MNFLRPLAIAVLVAAIAACSPTPKIKINGNAPLQHITIKDDRIGIRSADGDMAWIDQDGSLELDSKPVMLDAQQRELTRRYYSEAHGVREDGIAIGKSGVAMAGKSVSSVFRGLTGGKPDEIGPQIEAEAREIELSAMRLCERIGTLQGVQDELAQALPAFAPYATMTGYQAEDCAKRVKQAPSHRSASPEAGRDLIAAVDAGDLVAVKRLAGQGADVNVAIRGDGTPLIRAARRGELAIVEELLSQGAEVDLASRGDGNPLIAASMAGHQDVVARLLAADADVDTIVRGDETALINAARQGHLEIVKLLIGHGADVNLGVTADLGQWRSPLNQARDGAVRDYLLSQGAVAKK